MVAPSGSILSAAPSSALLSRRSSFSGWALVVAPSRIQFISTGAHQPRLHLLIALVLYTNLLIAMFNETYQRVMDHSDEEWKMNRVLKVKSYAKLAKPLLRVWA